MPVFRKRTLLLGAAAVLLLTTGGTVYALHAAQADSPAAAEAPPPPPPVDVLVVAKKPVQIWKDFSGRLRAVDYVEIRPQVSGSLQEIRFQDGQTVNKGDILFVIDPAPYEAAAAQAKAALQSAKNQYALAQKELERAEGLVSSGAIAKRIFDERQSTAVVTKNAVDSAQAQVRQAEIDVDHAYVKAPITGRISRAELTQGNLIQAGQSAPVLTTIASNDSIYADFEVDEQAYLQNVYSTARNREDQAKIPVEMTLKSGDGTPYKGVIESFDNHIDPASGTIRARAVFDNKDGALIPGMFASVRLGSSVQEDSILIPDKAIGTDQDRKFVYVVGKDGKIVYREIKPGASIDGERVILDGLTVGEQVVTDGIMKIRPDMVVTPKIVATEPKAETTAVSVQ